MKMSFDRVALWFARDREVGRWFCRIGPLWLAWFPEDDTRLVVHLWGYHR